MTIAGVQRQKHRVDGVLLLDKPRGVTSQVAVTRVKRALSAAKAGHTGTLDPMAEGLLPVCLGEATKFSHLLLDADKGYRARVQLGVTTTTGDAEGEVTRTVHVAVTRAAAAAAVKSFIGEIFQTPPMYSALRHGGRRLYEIARAGETVQREARAVSIRSIDVVALTGDVLTIDVVCSKGTYIRVLAEDIGAALGCGASLAQLIRTRVGGFRLEDTITLDRLEDCEASGRMRHLLPVDSLVRDLPRLDLDDSGARDIEYGRALRAEAVPSATGLARIYGPQQRFLGIVHLDPSGEIVPRRLMAQTPRRA